jgi:GT2 family glycosyltransferase
LEERCCKTTIAARNGTREISGKEVPTVSIIILNYNARAHLETCLLSLAELNYPRDNLEIIIVDNASTDGSVPWLKQRYPDVQLLVNSTNVGFARGINVGARDASGSYLAFLNPDTRVDKDWLLALLQTTLSETDVACAGSVMLNWTGDAIDYAGRPDDAMDLYPGHAEDSLATLRSAGDVPMLFASGGAMLVRRDIFLNLGGFDENYFLYCEDVDLGWRLWLHGYRVLRSTCSLVFHERGASSQQLDSKFVMCLVQKYALYTLLKNMEADQLWSILPGVLWYLVDRSRLFAAPESSTLGQAIRELTQEIETIWQKRLDTQSKRARTDAEIFAVCGHPFGFLFTNPNYSKFARYLLDNEGAVHPPAADAAAALHYMIKLLYHAYKFNYEQLLEQPMAHLVQEPSAMYSSRIWRIAATGRRLGRVLRSTRFFPALKK